MSSTRQIELDHTRQRPRQQSLPEARPTFDRLTAAQQSAIKALVVGQIDDEEEQCRVMKLDPMAHEMRELIERFLKDGHL